MRTVELIKSPKNNLITSVYNPRSARTSPDAVYQKLLKKVAENPERLNDDEWKFMARELPHLRTAYGVYLSICEEEKIQKPITWRTFYMQCRGLRTLKANTIKALGEYIRLINKNNDKINQL